MINNTCLVLDANIIIRAVLGKKVRFFIEKYLAHDQIFIDVIIVYLFLYGIANVNY